MHFKKKTCIKVDLIALIIVNSVYLAVVINYATQCEMIIFYIDEVRTRLEEKSVTIKEAMQVRIIYPNLIFNKIAMIYCLNHFKSKYLI